MSDALYDKGVTCPVCGHEFTTKKVKTSALRMIKRDTDFCTYYEGENPAYYGVYVCPKCGYSSFESRFLNVNKRQIALVKQKVMANWGGKDYGNERTIKDAIVVHKLALLNYNVIQGSKYDIAKACLRLAWFYRAQGDEINELLYTRYALENYEAAFTSEAIEVSGEKEYVLLYTMGELSRRLENYRKASGFYNKTIMHPEVGKRSQIRRMAQDQMQIAAEAYRKIKKAQGDLEGDDE